MDHLSCEPHDPDVCPVVAALNIRRSWQLLCTKSAHQHLPLAVYSNRRAVTMISSDTISKHLRHWAQSTYGITDPAELKRYSSHSLRVGACVQLHVAGKSSEFIQKSLRWKSDCFKMYLRNVGALAHPVGTEHTGDRRQRPTAKRSRHYHS